MKNTRNPITEKPFPDDYSPKFRNGKRKECASGAELKSLGFRCKKEKIKPV